MRPGDHPDFFRFPAPAGQSRESKLRIDRQGRFWNGDERVTHARMARTFASWIDRHPDDGRMILTNGYDWTYVTVEDAPFAVVSVSLASEVPLLTLTDGSCEPLEPATLRVGEAEALYVGVKGGRFEARFTPGSQTALSERLETLPGGSIGLRIGATVHPIATATTDSSAVDTPQAGH
jgi:hypothetical protein